MRWQLCGSRLSPLAQHGREITIFNYYVEVGRYCAWRQWLDAPQTPVDIGMFEISTTSWKSGQMLILWRKDPLPGNALNTHAANNTGSVFSVARARTAAMQRMLNTFSRTRWRHKNNLCFLLWSMPSGYRGQQKTCFLFGPLHVQCWAAGQ
jgi:hypothetical protein